VFLNTGNIDWIYIRIAQCPRKARSAHFVLVLANSADAMVFFQNTSQ